MTAITRSRTFLSLLLLAATILLPVTATAQTSSEKQAAKMKARVQKLGTGPEARIKVQLRDGRTVSGYIKEIKDNTFVLVSDQSGSATEIEYADARKPAHHLSRTAQVALGVVIGFAVILGITAAICTTHGCD